MSQARRHPLSLCDSAFDADRRFLRSVEAELNRRTLRERVGSRLRQLGDWRGEDAAVRRERKAAALIWLLLGERDELRERLRLAGDDVRMLTDLAERREKRLTDLRALIEQRDGMIAGQARAIDDLHRTVDVLEQKLAANGN